MSYDLIFGKTQRDWSCGSIPGPRHVETIVLLRHGEKPPGGLGQLDRRGLERSLALPPILESKFGKPNFIFAPNPQQQKSDRGHPYDYVRPLATIEPTAIRFGMPVNTQFGVMDIKRLKEELTLPRYQDFTILVAWEHKLAEVLAKDLVLLGTPPHPSIPKWKDDDFDSIYIVKLIRQDGKLRTTFSLDSQGLDGLDLSLPSSHPTSQMSLAGMAIGTALGLALATIPWRGENDPHPDAHSMRG